MGLRRGDPAGQALREPVPDAGLRVPGPGRGALAGSPPPEAGQVLLQLHDRGRAVVRRARRGHGGRVRAIPGAGLGGRRPPALSRPSSGRRLAGVLRVGGPVASAVAAIASAVAGGLMGTGVPRVEHPLDLRRQPERGWLTAWSASRRETTVVAVTVGWPADPGSVAHAASHIARRRIAPLATITAAGMSRSRPQFGPLVARFSFMSVLHRPIRRPIRGPSARVEDHSRAELWSSRGRRTEVSGEVARRQAFSRGGPSRMPADSPSVTTRATASSSVSRRPRSYAADQTSGSRPFFVIANGS